MVNYRRSHTPGASYFFTVTLRDRSADTLVRHVDELRNALRHVGKTRSFRIDAMVVLPDPLHAMWTLPPDDADYSGRWRAIKSRFVRSLVKNGAISTPNPRGEYDLWQRRFREHQIRDDRDFETHVDYIHINPVKHGLVQRLADWPWSTFHRYVRQGLLPADWASAPDASGKFGE